MTRARTLLGFDYGKKRIGVAVGQALTATATPAETLHSRADQPDWVGIARLIDTWHPQALIVGLPLNMDGTEQELTKAARWFGGELQQRYGLPVHWIDERLTTIEAGRYLAGTAKNARRRKADVDKVAAQLILETWLAQNKA
jgi:putative Holliday junction resolvase